MRFGTGARSDFWQLVMGDPDPSARYAREDDSVGIRIDTTSTGGLRCVAWGDADIARDEILRARDAFGPFDHLMIASTIYEAMSARDRAVLAPYWGNDWVLYWTDHAFPDIGDSARVELLRRGTPQYAAQFDAIGEALVASNPIATSLSHMEDFDWFVLRNDAGEIVTVMGATFDGTAHFAGLGTVPAHRGHGYGAATMIGAINASVEICDIVEFGVWSWNMGALRLYDRLGITRSPAVINGRHEPFEDLESRA